MPPFSKQPLFWSGVAALIGALLHMAIPIGGPDWYDFFGAPQQLVDLARIGAPYATISCLVIATILFFFAAYAFSDVGLIRRLPLQRTVLVLIASVLILRGIMFVPLVLWRPGALAGICDCRSIDAFIVVTSVICLTMGIGFAIGARNVWRLGRGKGVPLQAHPLHGSV